MFRNLSVSFGLTGRNFPGAARPSKTGRFHSIVSWTEEPVSPREDGWYRQTRRSAGESGCRIGNAPKGKNGAFRRLWIIAGACGQLSFPTLFSGYRTFFFRERSFEVASGL